jgi:hypothetical protein
MSTNFNPQPRLTVSSSVATFNPRVPVPNRGGSYLATASKQFGISLEGSESATLPYAYWLEVEPPLIGPEFCWNAANGVLAVFTEGSVTTVAGP